MSVISVIVALMNVIFFYAGWLVCLWSAQAGKGWVGMVFATAVLGFHCCIAKSVKKDLVLAFIVIVLGTLFDSLYQDLGWIRYASPNRLFPFLAPFWISGLYLLLAINLDHSLSWLKNRPYLAAVLGVWGAAASYIAGERMGAAELLSEWTIYYIGAIWIFFCPLLFWISRQLDRFFLPRQVMRNRETETGG